MTRPDNRKSLEVLQEEWANCTACTLGEKREEVGGQTVFGAGIAPKTVLLVGEAIGSEEEDAGIPLAGARHELVTSSLERLGLTNYYVTNCVICRSCAIAAGPDGVPFLRKNWKTKTMEPFLRDEDPTPAQIEACLPRLHEEIYLVDPVVIVALGPRVASAISGTHVKVSDRGREMQIEIPGASMVQSLTEKKKAWARRVGGKTVYPVEQHMVRYLMIPTLPLTEVEKKLRDRGPKSPFMLFYNDLKLAVKIYEAYQYEALGIEPTGMRDKPLDLNGDTDGEE